MAAVPVLHVRDVDSALAFYRDKLGFSVLWDMPDEASGKVIHAELEFDESQVMIGLLPEDSGDDGRLGAGIQLYFPVNRDVDEYFEQVRSAGVRIDQEPVDQFYGDRTFSVRHPHGYWLSFAPVGIPASKDELMARIDEAWEIFAELLPGLSEEQRGPGRAATADGRSKITPLTSPPESGRWSIFSSGGLATKGWA